MLCKMILQYSRRIPEETNGNNMNFQNARKYAENEAGDGKKLSAIEKSATALNSQDLPQYGRLSSAACNPCLLLHSIFLDADCAKNK